MTFDEYIGMQYPAPDEAIINIESHHCNPTGNINGGVLISLADNIATGAAGRAYLEKFGQEKFMVGVDLHASLLANQQGGTISGTATPIRVGKRVTVIRTQIVGNQEQLLAEVTSTHVPI